MKGFVSLLILLFAAFVVGCSQSTDDKGAEQASGDAPVLPSEPQGSPEL